MWPVAALRPALQEPLAPSTTAAMVRGPGDRAPLELRATVNIMRFRGSTVIRRAYADTG
jgi:hypothetical protein